MTLSPKKFRKRFDRLTPIILQEWPQLEVETLAETGGDLEAVINYIADQTERTRTRIQQDLTELYQIAKANEPKSAEVAPTEVVGLRDNLRDTLRDSLRNNLQDYLQDNVQDNLQGIVLPTVERTLDLLETRAETLLSQVEKDVLPSVKNQIRNKPARNLLTILGVGFLLGLLVGGLGRDRQ
ncbi:hypothetical protein C7B76_31640 [filamentous cyanobacterium CCP2]|nr:hypothetical protein C7B76_31640 [filamentous cyanobacterium CCP2]